MKPSVLILHASGTNRDRESAWAFEMAGGAPEIVHINQLRRGTRHPADYQLLVIPGGFSYGDALGAGSRLALDLQLYFEDVLAHFVAHEKPVLGICNGFQVLVRAGLLPGWHSRLPGTRRVTLTANERGRFECRWVHLAVDKSCRAGFLQKVDELIFCPVAHGEGNLQVKDEETLLELETEKLVAFRYVDGEGLPARGRYPLNPNGSVLDVAGLCNPAGNIVGLMPHPENHILGTQNPLDRAGQLGLQLFQALVYHAQNL